MRTLLLLAALPAALVATPALAQSGAGSDVYASGAIQRGDYAKAEKRLVARLEANPRVPEAQLNLATVYARTGRADAARALYADVLAQDVVMLDLANDQVVSSHALAKAGLRLLDRPLQAASR